MVVVAQLVEPQIVVLVVAGSSPVDHPILCPSLCSGSYEWPAHPLIERRFIHQGLGEGCPS